LKKRKSQGRCTAAALRILRRKRLFAVGGGLDYLPQPRMLLCLQLGSIRAPRSALRTLIIYPASITS
jgi:hypothetical protein